MYYILAAQIYEDRVRTHVANLATIASTVVDVEAHQQLRDPSLEGSELHYKTLAPLVAIHKKIPEIHYLYTMIYQGDQDFFVLNTAQDPAFARSDIQTSAIMEEYLPENEMDIVARTTLESGKPFVYPDTYEDPYGRFISAVAPLLNAQGNLEGFIGVDYRISVYEKQISRLQQGALIALVLGAIGSALLGWLSANQRKQSLDQISLQAAAEQEMRESKEEAEAALRAKNELLAIAAHDLKNPLAAIIGVADMVSMCLQNVPQRYVPDNTRTLFFKIPRYANNMLRIIEEVIKAETVERMGIHVADKPFNVTEVANEVVEFNRFACKKKNITIHYRCERAYFMSGDRDRIMEAFDNLVSNAVKYSPANSRVDIALGCDLAQTKLRFSVSDEGPGLSDADQRKLFQKFQKLSSQPTAGESSSGLGLSIVKHIVDAHRGDVTCESEEGFGATFIIELPIVESRPLYAETQGDSAKSAEEIVARK